MSVHSEFTRMVRSCAELLDASDAPRAEGFASSLLAACAISASDLSEAASRVLALAERAPSLAEIEFQNPVDGDTYRERLDRMLALSRSIIGRPPPED
jgi:hypothetical protein